MKTATFEFQAHEKDYIELIRFLPVGRFMRKGTLAIVTFVSISLLIAAVYLTAQNFIEGDNPFIVYTLLASGIFIFWAVNVSIVQKITNAYLKKQAMQIFNRYSHNGVSDEFVEYHQDQNLFLIRKTKKEVPVDQYFDIYETKDHYLFYRNKEKIDERFLIPKDVNPDQLMILISRLKSQGVKVTDRSR
ncbi:hypothetical protein [Jeotgalibacillus aurantiacus]|uniref:hypothetical protein n=1 Tax=Jeotgalibacillus aurantiacus TaxID=2763266 RepID=UPI001D0B004F|nr:hypothetical protein [Jeotgalibacillus aurantiacus]